MCPGEGKCRYAGVAGSHKAGSLKMNTSLEYSTRVVQEGGRRCKKSTLNDLVHLTPLRIPLMNPPIVILCNCGGHNTLNKSTLIFKCPCIVLWFGNLHPPFILPPPFRILNGGGRILYGGGSLNGGARFQNQTNPTQHI
jgi:hypothetical protein